MSIGYACLTVGVLNTDFKSCLLKNVNDNKLLELIDNNLNSLEKIIDYNIKNKIKLFRITSDLIPFGSSDVNQLPWWDIFKTRFNKISKKIIKSGMRVSMHPGQYTVLNSPNVDVVNKSINDLTYHTKVLDCLGVNKEHKIVLHIGGVYDNKQQAMKRFINNFQYLDESIKKRLVIENDDRNYHIDDVLYLSKLLKIPVIYDNLHNKIYNCDITKDDKYWIDLCESTWFNEDGKQKIHYSQQDPLKHPGAHSKSIDVNDFVAFHNYLNKDIDIMLEVKDKNISAIKCINCTSEINNLDLIKEWCKYQYLVLEKSPSNYLVIIEMFNSKKIFNPLTFYNIISRSLENESNIDNVINSVMFIWQFFYNIVLDNEKTTFYNTIEKYKSCLVTLKTLKNFLLKLAIKYDVKDLLESYYFI